ncbi:MAG: 16S rRNA (cytosine(967)-C(5))-methyltransferase RsmB [Propionivibrio sp.]|uniref:16S rRNA (cytosine(967)-C(5))-methyltransferase RsmB n=1 Tax=Propionivibrio sp. TaxID=2212460 RepID=UPI001A3A526F|nr:16S rRNA (cytosine(967)-C(5))-methyltransferase RsmB [Propionivibrio sp.]MBL8413285.1 16S rRNA (cytosine(967)-C(5))-methyltransferase RsmB [Propionivibrio sp.]
MARPGPSPQQALASDSLGWSLLLAARVLAAVGGGKSLSEALGVLAKEPPAARAAAQDVSYGVLRRYAWGQFILARLLSRPLTHAETQSLLLAALYRLETRPEATPMVVDQAVAAAGELAGGVFKGLVNGVLRNFLRQRESLLAALAADEEATYQHPRWWLARLRRAHPENWLSIVAVGNSPPPMTLRVNQRRGTVADYMIRLEAAGFSARALGAGGVLLQKPVSVEALPGFFDGFVSVQDAGAQRAAELLAPAPGSRVLDACAAPGGKTAHLLESATLDLLALDIDASRTKRIEENLQRLGLRATIQVADCREVAHWWDGQPFDAILADVPCSASGVVRRHPDIKHLRRESDIRRFVHTQADILDALWPLLKAGGKLLYATCSVFPEENAAQIDAFLVRQSGVERLHEEQLLPQDENDGFYYALLRKAA